MHHEPRANNVIAVGRVECLVLERSDFNRLLGNVEEEMEKEMKRREMMQQHLGSRDQASINERSQERTDMRFEDLRQLRTIGTGTFGRVKLVQHSGTGRVCALKAMQKEQIVSSHQERNIMNEKNILAECRHPFVLELVQTYSSPNQLFMLMELVQGGELWSYIYEKFDALPRTSLNGFQLPAAKFYAGCVISAFEYIHAFGVAYRDLKPENLLLDHQGYMKVIDFGFAKHIPYYKGTELHNHSFTLCGTPEYLSPELVLSRGHDKSVDYWALGCLIYELIVGHTPFQDDVQSEIFKKIIHSDRSLRFPSGFDPQAKDLVQKLLSPNPAFRLGNMSGLVQDIKCHAWYEGFNWNDLEERNMETPYVPTINDPLDTSNFDPYPEDDHVPPYTGSQRKFEGF
jgi:cGMP-dependent protein kinase